MDENINNNTGISIFAVFDGHGGEFAADYAKDVLIQNVYNKIVEAHNIISGKVEPQVTKKEDTKANTGEGECNAGGGDNANDQQSKPKTPVLNGTAERRNSFRKATSFADDTPVKKRSGPDPLDIYKLNGLGPRPMTKDDFMLSGSANGGKTEKVAPQSQEAKCYIGADRKINFGKLLTDEVLAADHKLVETVKKMVSDASCYHRFMGGLIRGVPFVSCVLNPVYCDLLEPVRFFSDVLCRNYCDYCDRRG